MLNDKLKKTIQQAYSRLLESKGHKPRYGQRLMIADIARILGNIDKSNSEQQHVCTLEAGTGTGKTIAYFIASLPIAKEHKKKLVISTATIALQEQILLKDLPDILRHSGLQFSYTLAKGRKRYLCLHNLNNFIAQKDAQNLPLFTSENDQNLLNNKNDMQLYQQMSQEFHQHHWNGERDSWEENINESSWFPITSDQHQCSGKRCSYYEECVFYKAREAVFKVDCIVANHDLVLSDLNMGGGYILPPPDECIYIFDEGHHLPTKAINHFSYTLKLHATKSWLEQTKNTLLSFADLTKPPTHIQTIIKDFPDLVQEITDLFKQLETLLYGFHFPENTYNQASLNENNKNQVYRFEFGKIPDALSEQCEQLEKLFQKIYQQIDLITVILKDTIDDEITGINSDVAEQWLPVFSPLNNRSEAAMKLFNYFSTKDKSDLPPNARWLKKIQSNDENDIELACSPILAANSLEQILWSQCYGAVITSATIAALGSFDRFVLNAGVPGYFNILPSPFDFQKNVEFIVPEMLAEANHYQSHTDEIIKLLPEIINSKKATLVLFSSRKQMNEVEYALLRQGNKWKNLLLTQGHTNKLALLKTHKKQIDKGEGSVIFGLASFAEGIDLPGDYCQHVIIAKLPFAVPDNPVDASLTEWLESQGRNAFMEITVPDASLRLIQACGRLIRKESDRGKITLLDKRIITKFYGKKILRSLPPYTMKLNQ